MKLKYTFLLISVTLSYAVYAQQDKAVIRFVDASRQSALKGISLTDGRGHEIGYSDTSGYAVIPLTALDSGKFLVAFLPGYKLDTIRAVAGLVQMVPLSDTLNEFRLSGNRIRKLLHAPDEYVADYELAGDNLLVMTYSGNDGSHAKLFLIDKNGNVLAKSKIPSYPEGLYKSCVGKCYAIYTGRFYPVSIDSDKIALGTACPANLLEGLEQCNCSVNGNLYYRLTDRNNFIVQYGMIKKGEIKFRPIVKFEERETARASFNEWIEILQLLERHQFDEAARKQSLRLMWDRGSLAHINMPIINVNDTLVVFDFFKKQLLFYDLSGQPMGSVAINFNWRQSQRFEILKDEHTQSVYIHYFGNDQAHTLEKLNIGTGAVEGKPVAIGRSSPEHVKIDNGDIYFLCQNRAVSDTRQIYVQHADIYITETAPQVQGSPLLIK